LDVQDGLRASLIAAALKFMEVEGQAPSLRAVARAAGVSAMAPYRHFADKADLLAAVANHGFEILATALSAADDQPDPRQALIAQGMAFIAFARSHPALFQLMYSHQYGSAGTDAVLRTYEILARRVAQILPAQAAAATLACRSMVQGLATIELSGRLAPARPEDIAPAVRLLVTGLATSAGGLAAPTPAA
jgi:AcrR family transcriptional regulator